MLVALVLSEPSLNCYGDEAVYVAKVINGIKGDKCCSTNWNQLGSSSDMLRCVFGMSHERQASSLALAA